MRLRVTRAVVLWWVTVFASLAQLTDAGWRSAGAMAFVVSLTAGRCRAKHVAPRSGHREAGGSCPAPAASRPHRLELLAAAVAIVAYALVALIGLSAPYVAFAVVVWLVAGSATAAVLGAVVLIIVALRLAFFALERRQRSRARQHAVTS